MYQISAFLDALLQLENKPSPALNKLVHLLIPPSLSVNEVGPCDAEQSDGIHVNFIIHAKSPY